MTTVVDVNITSRLGVGYTSYAMSVLKGRAIPDIRDGLKPVHRRVLYAMYDNGMRAGRPHVKSARPVAETMGHYHPHGDSSIYDSLVRMAQPWSMRYPLIDGQGNFGSPGNDGPAAMRYTESRLTAFAENGVLAGLHPETVDWVDNYDGKTTEPTVLPSPLPNLLLNGANGIAVGMSTNIPPHNMREVAAAVTWALEHPNASESERHAAYTAAITGPDFPTGGTAVSGTGMDSMYATGRGSFTVTGTTRIEPGKRGTQHIIVTELPYQVNPDAFTAQIAAAMDSGKLASVTEVQDETSNREGMRIVISCRAGTNTDLVTAALHKHTSLQQNYSARLIAFNGDIPRVHTLTELIDIWIDHQIDVVQRQARLDLATAQRREHIVTGLHRAAVDIDQVIAIIRASDDTPAARTGLMSALDIDTDQADAILALALGKLTRLAVLTVEKELEELRRAIKKAEELLASSRRQRTVVRKQVEGLSERFGDERRTRIVDAHTHPVVTASSTLTVPAEPVVVEHDTNGYLRSHPATSWHKRATQPSAPDTVTWWPADTTDTVLAFGVDGKVHKAVVADIPIGRKNVHTAALFKVDTSLSGVHAVGNYDRTPALVHVTRQGRVHRVALSDYSTNRTTISGTAVRDGDSLVSSILLPDNATDIVIATELGMVLRFPVTDARTMGRTSSGVTGIRLSPHDNVVAVAAITPDDTGLITVTTNGWVTRVPLHEYPVQNRGGKGTHIIGVDSRHGKIVTAAAAGALHTVALSTDDRNVTHTSVRELNPTTRTGKGTQLVKATVIASAITAPVLHRRHCGVREA